MLRIPPGFKNITKQHGGTAFAVIGVGRPELNSHNVTIKRTAYHEAGHAIVGRICEGIVSKRLGSLYKSGRSPHWLKIKNPKAPAVSARPRRIGGANPLSPTKGEHLRAAITCLAETNPPWPTRLRRSKRRLRHNQERSHVPHPSRQRCDPQRPLLVIIGADVVTALPRATRARKGERLRGKSYSYREGDTRKPFS
jgi:hypothetical protein